jgi:hypothetical protein
MFQGGGAFLMPVALGLARLQMTDCGERAGSQCRMLFSMLLRLPA